MKSKVNKSPLLKKQIKKEGSFCDNEMWQDGYKTALEDIRDELARNYNVNPKTVILMLIQYLYRPIVDFKNMQTWKTYSVWTKDNLP